MRKQFQFLYSIGKSMVYIEMHFFKIYPHKYSGYTVMEEKQNSEWLQWYWESYEYWF